MIPTRRQQIHKKGQNVECKDERNDPFKHRSDVLVSVRERSSHEDGGEDDFKDDEKEFQPEGRAKDAVLSEVDAKALIFGADKDGGDDVAGHEEEEEAIV